MMGIQAILFICDGMSLNVRCVDSGGRNAIYSV